MTENRTTELYPCPFCGGEAHIEKYCDMCSTEIDFKCARDKSPDAICAIGEEVFWVEHKCELLSNDEELHVGCFTSAREAIAAWNTRADYHGYKQAAIEAWENIKAWNARATHGALTAEQVREAIMSADRWEKPMGDTGLTNTHLIIRDDGWQAIADELNAELGSDTKPCYAADENYKRCKYSVNRGWCDNAPFLVWDDTGHLFITMGGLKTWDVTGDAKKWFAELGSGTCEFSPTTDNPPTCSNCGWQADAYDCDWLVGGTYEYNGRFCKNCGAQVRKAVTR